METTEIREYPAPEPGIILNLEAQAYLKEAGKWSAFLGIIGFIICGLILLMALFIGTILSMVAKFSPDPTVATTMAGNRRFYDRVVYPAGYYLLFLFIVPVPVLAAR